MKIIAFYKDLCLVEKDGVYAVVQKNNEPGKRILFHSRTEEESSKAFIMMVAGFINESLEVTS